MASVKKENEMQMPEHVPPGPIQPPIPMNRLVDLERDVESMRVAVAGINAALGALTRVVEALAKDFDQSRKP